MCVYNQRDIKHFRITGKAPAADEDYHWKVGEGNFTMQQINVRSIFLGGVQVIEIYRIDILDSKLYLEMQKKIF